MAPCLNKFHHGLTMQLSFLINCFFSTVISLPRSEFNNGRFADGMDHRDFQVDQMISSQLGSLNTAAPAGPVWREPKQLEQMKDMEEGKKESDELAPMYVEGCLDCKKWALQI